MSVRFLLWLIAGWLVLSPLEPQAHGNWLPRHGGLMNNEGGEITFELVVRGRDTVIYLSDHGEAMPTDGARGTLTVTHGELVWSAGIRSDGGNRLVGRLPRAPIKGDRLVAHLKFRNGSIGEGRFEMK